MATKKKKSVTKKPSKPRANKYDEKLQINGTFEDLLKELAKPKEIKKAV